MDHVVPRSHAYSSSDAPPVAPRPDLALRRYHSSNPDDRVSLTKQKPYESDYEKVNKLLRHSLYTKNRKGNRRVPDQENTVSEMGPRPRTQTNILVQPVIQEDEDIYLSPEEIASMPQSVNSSIQMHKSTSIPQTANPPLSISSEDTQNHPTYAVVNKKSGFKIETAIYGVAQGKGSNFVMEMKEIQRTVNKFYGRIMSTNSNTPEIADLRTHLRTGDKAPMSDILRKIHLSLQPPELHNEKEENDTMYLVDFHNCESKSQLREKLLRLFTIPGPPSIAYQRVTAKLDALIHTFAEIVITLRAAKNETIVSPYHAQSILQNAASETDQLIKVLQANELWIKWGTETGLPPLNHVYMLKQSPTYEMRKSIVLSIIAEKCDVIKAMLSHQVRQEELIPPIYSKLESEEGEKWQVTEYDPDTKSLETRETAFPIWITECPKLSAHLKSPNRTKFKHGDHTYALYSVYLVVIKDITMAEGNFPKESRIPCSHQIYVGSSSTGVLYKFMNVENNHCDHIKDILDRSSMLKTFRCHQDSELVEACLALSWARRQPRAVFVINSFQEGNMAKLSLNKKKPFHDKMINLEQHYISSKKLGPANDMRYGMNKLGDNISP
uniref:uncharacterized protein LOC120347163 n=1 Tax=Styela clava TaxID=7725 RepID=UPI0019393FD3|nr:uncharacterized protein LOC120347163 [Styela clava]